MLVENNKANRIVQQVAATMAIEEMYISKEHIKKLQDVASGKLDVETAIQERLSKYER